MKHKCVDLMMVILLVFSLVLSGCMNSGKTSSEAPVSSSTEAQETSGEQTMAPTETETEPVSTEVPTEPGPTEPEGPTKEDILKSLHENYPNLLIVTGENGLNVRQRPTTEAPVIGKLTEGAGANDIGDSEREGWLHVRSGQVDGYVSAEFVTWGDAAYDRASELAKERLFITVERANIRRAPSTDSDVLDIAEQGALFDILAEKNGFYQVPFLTYEAYISEICGQKGWYLKEAVPVALPEPTVPDTQPTEPVQTTQAVQPTSGASGFAPQQIITGWNGHAVCIDPGHQRKGISSQEPIAPGSSQTKTALSTGTCGVVTRVDEHVVNLQVSLKLRDILVSRGYTVIMIRITDDCPVTNSQRAQVANESGADLNIRVHCNGIDNQSTTGIINYAPKEDNAYMDAETIRKSIDLARIEGECLCAITGAKNLGVLKSNEMTGINWSKIPVTIIEMGFMSNPDEDRLLNTDSYQNKLAEGIANGIDQYFASH